MSRGSGANASGPEQMPMIVVGEATGQMSVRDFSDADGIAVNRIEQKLHLMNTLSHLASASMRDGLLRAGEAVVTDRYGARAPEVIAGAAREHEAYLRRAKWSFADAVGQTTMEAAGVSREVTRPMTRADYETFFGLYYGSDHHTALYDFRRQLKTDVDNLMEQVSVFNRTNELRPHQAEPLPKDVPKEQREELGKMSSRERLVAILHDPRAGFIPATNREKTLVMSFLDYLDNPEYPLGVTNQLLEVFIHQQKPRNRSFRDGCRSTESIVWEIGDYLADAAQTYRLVDQLDVQNREVSPRVSLAEEPEIDSLSAACVTRFLDIGEFIRTGETGVHGLSTNPARDSDPLLTTEDRWDKQGGNEPGKRKTVHSNYTTPNTKPAFAGYLAGRMQQITFKELREVANDIRHNELARAEFFLRCLTSVEASPLRDRRLMQPVIDAARQSLERVADEPVVQLLANERLESAA